VWQRSVELSVAVYKLTRKFPPDEFYGLTSQLRRASVSVASNIAEGYGRASRPEFRRFAAIARGSALELQTQLLIARKLDLTDGAALKPVEALADETGKMLWALMETLNENRQFIADD
jgi:four helix bundle protein